MMTENPVFNLDEIKDRNGPDQQIMITDKDQEASSDRTLVMGRRGIVIVIVFVLTLCLATGILVYFLRPECHQHAAVMELPVKGSTVASQDADDVTTSSYEPCANNGLACSTGE